MNCEVCKHSDEHGWNGLPTDTSHCRRCHQEWTGHSAGHCVECCRTFGSESAFTKAHEYRKQWKCWSDLTLKRRGFRKLERKRGSVWVGRAKPVAEMFKES